MSLYKGNKLIANIVKESEIKKITHDHYNSIILNKFSESDEGNILYNGNEIIPNIINIFSILNIYTTESELFNKEINITTNNSVICNTKFDKEGKAKAIIYSKDKSINPSYSISCEDIIENIIINNEGIYDVELSFLSSYINITTGIEGSTVIVELISEDGKEYKKQGIIDSSGSTKIKVGVKGKYKVYSTYKTGISSTEIVEITENNQTKDVTLNFATLVITTTTEKYIGLNITIKDEENKIISSFTSTGNDIIYLPELKTYTISAISEISYKLIIDGYITYTKTIDEMGIGNDIKIITFTDGTEEEIIDMINAHYNNEINISNYWSVGDKRIIHVNRIASTLTFFEETLDQDIEIRIIGIEHDKLKSSINGHSKACITVECVPILYTKVTKSGSAYIHGTSTNTMQDRYNYLNNNFKAALSTIISNNIKEVTKYFSTALNTSKIVTTYMNCFILTVSEVYNTASIALINASQGYQYDYYKTESNRNSDFNFNTTTQKGNKWTFSLYNLTSATHYITRTNTGYSHADVANAQLIGFSPAFCL